MRLEMLVASLDATHGSVIAKHERISPLSSGLQPLLLLQRGTELRQDLHVAGVGRRAVRRFAEQRRRSHHLAQRRVLEVRQARAVLGLGEEEVPEVALARLGLQLLHDRRREMRVARLVALAAVDRFRGPDDLVVEFDELGLQLVGPGARCEVHSSLLDTPDRIARPYSSARDRDPAGRPARPRTRRVHRGPVRGPAARRSRRRRHQDRAARSRRHHAPLRRTRRRPEPLVAGDRPQQAIGRDRPARRARPRRRAPHRGLAATSCSRTSSPARWPVGASTTTTLAADNPGVVLVHVSGFGQSGPRAAEPGFGSIGEAMGGIRHTTGEPDRPPARTGVSIGDSLAGLFAVVGALAALNERSRSGAGSGGRRRDLRGGDGADGVDGRRLRARRRDPDAIAVASSATSRPRTRTRRSTVATS